MNGVLVRIGIDQSLKGGNWNAPVDLNSREFVYVPIPDSENKNYRPGLRRGYEEIMPVLEAFAIRHRVGLSTGLGFPPKLSNRAMHLDPDFDYLTYGDNGAKQGSRLKSLGRGDLVVFFSSLRAIEPTAELVYALVGLFIVEESLPATAASANRCGENAHTRWNVISEQDVIIRANRGLSGRLEQCIPIGKLRNGAYRLTAKMNKAWGGLEVKDGFLQRRVTPHLRDPDCFYDWFKRQKVRLVRSNN
jgi:hypothetical protein